MNRWKFLLFFIASVYSFAENINSANNDTDLDRNIGVWLGLGIPVLVFVCVGSFLFLSLGCVLCGRVCKDGFEVVQPIIPVQGTTADQRIDLFLENLFNSHGGENQPKKGTSQKVIDENSTLHEKLKDTSMYNNDDHTCTICTECFREEEVIRELPCEHFYHKDCVDKWLLEYNANCPTCRHVIVEPVTKHLIPKDKKE